MDLYAINHLNNFKSWWSLFWRKLRDDGQFWILIQTKKTPVRATLFCTTDNALKYWNTTQRKKNYVFIVSVLFLQRPKLMALFSLRILAFVHQLMFVFLVGKENLHFDLLIAWLTKEKFLASSILKNGTFAWILLNWKHVVKMWTCKRCGKPVYFGELIFFRVYFNYDFLFISL